MRQKMRYRLWALPRRAREADAMMLLLGTLRRIGWTRSVAHGFPVDAELKPLPWWTYPAIHWTMSVLAGDERVLEFGSGNSTLWLASRVGRVTTVEDDEVWSARIAGQAPPNVEVLYRPCAGDIVTAPPADPYVGVLDDVSSGSVDLLVVDGKARGDVLLAAGRVLVSDGIALLDNADRPELAGSIDALQADGFGRIDFVGPVPSGTNMSCTSVFFRRLDARWRTPRRTPEWWGTEIADFVTDNA
jgi:hypothetical protein